MARIDYFYDANDGFKRMYEWLEDVLTPVELFALGVVININGRTPDTIDDFLYCLYGYDFEQFIEIELGIVD